MKNQTVFGGRFLLNAKREKGLAQKKFIESVTNTKNVYEFLYEIERMIRLNSDDLWNDFKGQTDKKLRFITSCFPSTTESENTELSIIG